MAQGKITALRLIFPEGVEDLITAVKHQHPAPLYQKPPL